MVLRLSAWGIFLLGAVGLLIHSTLLQTGHIRAGMFCFYTNLSNLLVLVYELALAIAAGLPHSAVLRLLTDDTLSFSMALCILVTHLVYQFVLVPDAKRNGKRFADFGASFGNLKPISASPERTAVITLSAPKPVTRVKLIPSSAKYPFSIATYCGA